MFRTRRVKCPDGRILRVYKDVDDVFPTASADTARSLQVGIDAAQQLSAQLQGDSQKTINQVATHLDQINGTLREKLRAAYIVFQIDPCNNSQEFTRTVREVNEREQRLREIAITLEQIRFLVASGSTDATIGKLAKDVLAMLVTPTSVPVIDADLIERRNAQWALPPRDLDAGDQQP